MPGPYGFHIGNDAFQQFGALIQETELAQLVVLLGGESVGRGLLGGAYSTLSFLNRALKVCST